MVSHRYHRALLFIYGILRNSLQVFSEIVTDKSSGAVCSSLDGPFCPLINGLERPSPPQKAPRGESQQTTKVNVITGNTVEEAVRKAQKVLREILVQDLAEQRDSLDARDHTTDDENESEDYDYEYGPDPSSILLDLYDWEYLKQSTVRQGRGPSFAVDALRSPGAAGAGAGSGGSGGETGSPYAPSAGAGAARGEGAVVATRREASPWWEIDLVEPLPVYLVEVWNPSTEKIWVLTSNEPFPDYRCAKEQGCQSFDRALRAAEYALEPVACAWTMVDRDEEEVPREYQGLGGEEVGGGSPMGGGGGGGGGGRGVRGGGGGALHAMGKKSKETMNLKMGFKEAYVCTYEFQLPVNARYIRLQMEETASMVFSEVDVYVVDMEPLPEERRQEYMRPPRPPPFEADGGGNADADAGGDEGGGAPRAPRGLADLQEAFVFQLPPGADPDRAMAAVQGALQETLDQFYAEEEEFFSTLETASSTNHADSANNEAASSHNVAVEQEATADPRRLFEKTTVSHKIAANDRSLGQKTAQNTQRQQQDEESEFFIEFDLPEDITSLLEDEALLEDIEELLEKALEMLDINPELLEEVLKASLGGAEAGHQNEKGPFNTREDNKNKKVTSANRKNDDVNGKAGEQQQKEETGEEDLDYTSKKGHLQM